MSTFATANAIVSTKLTCGASGTTNNGVLTPSSLEFWGATSAVNMSYTDMSIVSTTQSLNIAALGLTFGGAAGSVGSLLLSAGAGVMPTWLADSATGYYLASGGTTASPVWTLFPAMPTAYTIYRGVAVSPPLISGTCVFGVTLPAVPSISVTADTGASSTLIVPICVTGITGTTSACTGFTWTSGQTGLANVFWQAVVV